MAVTSVKILHSGWTGTETAGTGITFNVVYQVEVDDRNDGPLTIINADDGTNRIPMPNESYNVGNEVDAFAFVKSVSPAPVSEKVWNVTVTYGPLEPPESPDGPNGQEPDGLDPDDQPTDDPISEAPKISVTAVNVKRAANASAYIGQVHNRTQPDENGVEIEVNQNQFIAGTPPVQLTTTPDGKGGIKDKTPITNSVFTVFDPPPEIDYSQIRVIIKMNLNEPPIDWLDFVNSVNTEQIIFTNGVDDFAFARPFACRCLAVSYNERIKNGVLFFATDIEFLIDNLFTHRLDILDRGYCQTSNKRVSEAATKNNIVDESGLPLAEPVLLDGQGGQLDLEELDAVYLRYAVYPEFDFNGEGWGINNPLELQQKMNGNN